MKYWKKFLNSDTLDWLLEEDNPSIRYFSLVELLETPLDDIRVIEAKKKIMTSGIVPKIFARQKKEGFWEKRENFYISSKYKGTVWTFHLLTYLGCDPHDERLLKTCEFILENSQDKQSGGFSIRIGNDGGGDHNGVEPCLTGNMIWCLIKAGYLNDKRVQKGIRWILKYQRYDDGASKSPEGWPYEGWEMCWGKHSCTMGVVKTLKALIEIPVSARTPEIKSKIESAVEYLLKHRIFKKSSDLKQVAKGEWLKFGFPRFWDTDALEILGILATLECKDKRMKEALDLIISKQRREGKWNLESTWSGRMQCAIEQKGKPSKWVTLHALKALKNVGLDI